MNFWSYDCESRADIFSTFLLNRGTTPALMWLSSCRLQGSLPSSLGSLRALRELYLNSNELTGTIPNSFTDMTNLRQLYLSENFLSGTLHTDFYKLINLSK